MDPAMELHGKKEAFFKKKRRQRTKNSPQSVSDLNDDDIEEYMSFDEPNIGNVERCKAWLKIAICEDKGDHQTADGNWYRWNENMSNMVDKEQLERDKLAEEMERKQIERELKKMETTALWVAPWVLVFKFIYTMCFRYRIRLTPRKAPEKLKKNVIAALKYHFCGLLSGILIGYCAFVLFLFTFSHSPRLSTLVSAYIMLFAVFGIAFSPDFRCVALLTLPYLAASRIRWLLMLFASSMTIAGPGLNFLQNSANFRNSIACILAQVSTNVRLLQRLTMAPFSVMITQMERMVGNLNQAIQQIRDALININLSFLKVTNVMSDQAGWINSLVTSCSDKIALENQCLAFFNNVFLSCRAEFGSFGFLCNLIRSFASGTCGETESLSKQCDKQAALLEHNMNITNPDELNEQMNSIIDLIGRKNLTLEGNFKQYQNFTLASDYSVVHLVEKKIDNFVKIVETAQVVFQWFLVIWTLITMLQLIVNAMIFKKTWLHSDTFQNVYITKAFVQQERRALLQGYVPTIPLVRRERETYKKFSSIRWTKTEEAKAFRSIILLFLWMLGLVLVILTDYGMYNLLIIIEPIFSTDFSGGSEADVAAADEPIADSTEQSQSSEPSISGDSSFANIVKSLVSMLNPLRDIALNIDVSGCKPGALEPKKHETMMIFGALALTLVSVYAEVYILRLRHVIMIWYYPARGVQRAAWLRTHIRNNRGLFHRISRANVKDDFKRTRVPPKLSFVAKLVMTKPRLRRVLELMGIKRVMCTFCGCEGNPSKRAKFTENFTQCSECGGYFCKMCQVDLDHICVVCKTPLYALTVEVDFEKLSDDEEFEGICARYLRRVEQHKPKPKTEQPLEEEEEEGEEQLNDPQQTPAV